MKEKIGSSFLLAVSLFFIVQSARAQFNDNFSSAAPWTLVGSGLSVSGGMGNFNGAGAGGDNRMYRFLSPTNACLDVTNWSVDVDFHPTSTSSSGVNHTVLSMTSGSQNPYQNTFGGPYTDQSFVEIKYFASSGLPGLYRLQIAYKDGANAPVVSTANIPAAPGATYYLELTKFGNTLTLSAYTNALHTIQYSGSPISMTAAGHYASGLNCLQFGGIMDNPAAPRYLTGWIDNISIGTTPLVLGCNCSFWDDYATPADWNQVGATVTVAGGTLNFGATPDGNNIDRRVWRNLGGVIAASNCWAADFDFNAAAVGMGGPGHVLMALTAGNLNPLADPVTYATTDQDALMVYWASSPIGNNPANFQLRGYAKDGVNYFSSGTMIIAVGVQYYMRLERLDATNARLSVFTDAARTIHAIGSPLCFAIPATITNLDFIQHGNSVSGGVTRNLTATIDNTCIRNMIPPSGGTITGPVDICENGQPYIENTDPATGGTWAWTYQWESSVGCTGTWTAIAGATATDLVAPAISSTTCYRRKAFGPCGVIVYSNSVTVNVKKILHPSIAVSGYDGVCDQTGALTASVPASENYGVSYSWNTGATTPSISVSNTTPTTYTVTVTNGCNTATVSAVAAPCYHPTGTSFPAFSWPVSFCVDWSGSNPSEYFWIMDNTMSAGAGPAYGASEGTLQIFNRGGLLLWEQHEVAGCGGFWNGIFVWNGIYAGLPVTSDDYDWKLTLKNCSGYVQEFNGFVNVSGTCRLANPALTDSTATDPAGVLGDASVFPNPGNGIFHATFGNASVKAGEIRKIEIMNSLGQQVKEVQVNSSQNKVEIDLSGEASGIYFFRFVDGDNSRMMKVIKE